MAEPATASASGTVSGHLQFSTVLFKIGWRSASAGDSELEADDSNPVKLSSVQQKVQGGSPERHRGMFSAHCASVAKLSKQLENVN